MASPGRDPQRPKLSSQQGHGSGSRDGVGATPPPRSEKERGSSGPTGQRPRGSQRRGSSFLLQQLIHRYQESFAGRQADQGEAEDGGESEEESEESEMPNVEVCAPTRPFPAPSPLQQQRPAPCASPAPTPPRSFPRLSPLSSPLADSCPSLPYCS